MSNWTDERVKLLKQYWAEGLSASQIAARVGVVSRNGVIGKIHRLGLAATQPANKPRTARTGPRKSRLVPAHMWRPKQAKSEPPQEAAPLPLPAADDIARVSFAQLEDHHCRYLPFEPKDGFCGLEKVAGTSYCAQHLQRCTGMAHHHGGNHRALTNRFGPATANQAVHKVDIRDLETIA